MRILQAPVMDSKARDLALEAEEHGSDAALLRMVAHLRRRCALPEVRAGYECESLPSAPALPYPLDADGFAVGFDPLEDEAGFRDCWQSRGIVVGRGVAAPPSLAAAVARMREAVLELAGPGLDLDDPASWNRLPSDPAGIPFVSRGFLELYHDAAIADLRQSVRAYLHHVLIWGRADLWTSFDRLGMKLPGHEDSAALPLHVDQNPRVHPGFRTVQGVLALEDCPAERGTFVGAPGSRALFGDYADAAPERGEYVELPPGHPIRGAIEPRPVPIRAGDLVTWDSRTTHANSANLSGRIRYVAYMAAGPAARDEAMGAARQEAYASGAGSNLRDALMHASKKPRYTAPASLAGIRRPERLTALGRLLYGLDRYGPEPGA